jgi:hypothetical protein
MHSSISCCFNPPAREGVELKINDDPVASTDYKDGALMEPRGCNWWQSVANAARPKTAENVEIFFRSD